MSELYRLFRLTAIVIILTQAVFSPARADDTLFVVEGVKVDVTAADAVAAQTEAFAKARTQAFQTIAERLLPETERAEFKVPEADMISRMVKDFEITDEQVSNVQYVGTYTFRFKPESVRKYFARQGVSYTDIRSKPLLILPFYQWGSKTVLWGENNPWLAAWGRAGASQGLVPTVTPIGDLADVSDIDDADALSFDAARLAQMAGRYNAGEAIVLLAEPSSAAEANGLPSSLKISIYRTDRGSPEFIKDITATTQDAATGSTIFDAAVKITRDSLQKDWKTRTVAKPEATNRLTARVTFTNPRQWAETQRILTSVQGLSEVKLLSLSPRDAAVELVFTGDEERLRLALSQADMTLSAPQVNFSNPYAFPLGNPDNAGSALTYSLYLNKYQPSAAPANYLPQPYTSSTTP